VRVVSSSWEEEEVAAEGAQWEEPGGKTGGADPPLEVSSRRRVLARLRGSPGRFGTRGLLPGNDWLSDEVAPTTRAWRLQRKEEGAMVRKEIKVVAKI